MGLAALPLSFLATASHFFPRLRLSQLCGRLLRLSFSHAAYPTLCVIQATSKKNKIVKRLARLPSLFVGLAALPLSFLATASHFFPRLRLSQLCGRLLRLSFSHAAYPTLCVIQATG